MELLSFRRRQPTINLAAMIDVAFILVIFVVLAASFHRVREIEVELPAAEGASRAEPDPGELLITVPASGPIRVEGSDLEEEALRGKLGELRPRFRSVLLVADEAVALARAVRILSEARAAGFSSLAIATKESEPHGPRAP